MKKITIYAFATLFIISLVSANEDIAKIAQKKTKNYIDMVCITNEKATYKIGNKSQNFDVDAMVYPFDLNKYETTYALWLNVKLYGETNGYVFENDGQEGSKGRKGKPLSKENSMMPVVCVSYRDVIVWCNALSELYGLKPCYTYNDEVLKDSTQAALVDLVDCDFSATGFRLPSEKEWEFAARKKGNELLDSDTLSQNSAKYYNIHSKGTQDTGKNSAANASGIYDMTGNVLEFCFDWYNELYEPKKFGSQRVCRGGSWSEYTPFYFSGDRYAYESGEFYDYLGFRICRTHFDD